MGSAEEVLTEFREKGFTLLSIGQNPDIFINALQKTLDFTWHACASGVGIQRLLPEKPQHPLPTETQNALPAETQNILLTLIPASMKPKDFFGLPPTLIQELAELGAKHRILLYLFGNPYLLTRLPNHNFSGIICAFQPQPVFQEVAASHFLGELKAPGELPIVLNYDE